MKLSICLSCQSSLIHTFSYYTRQIYIYSWERRTSASLSLLLAVTLDLTHASSDNDIYQLLTDPNLPMQSRIHPTVPSPPQAKIRKSGISQKKFNLRKKRRQKRGSSLEMDAYCTIRKMSHFPQPSKCILEFIIWNIWRVYDWGRSDLDGCFSNSAIVYRSEHTKKHVSCVLHD